LRNPLKPKEVDNGACQEVVTADGPDVLRSMPILKYTETDPGRILGGGVVLLSGPDIGTCISYKRMHFRGKDWASLAFIPGSHFEHWVLARRRENRNLPLTVNLSASPAVMAVAASGLLPAGSDELAFAGALQGAPVEICRAKTVDAYSIANAEMVIEGYVDTSSPIGESEQAEKDPSSFAPFFPEWHGHEGKADMTYKFVVTGVTRRKDNPIYEVWLAHSLQLPIINRLTNDAPLFEHLSRVAPGLVTDVNSLDGMKGMGLVIQVKKRTRRDDNTVRNLVLAAFSMGVHLRTVFVVDDDVDIYNAEEIMWALHTRFDPKDNMIVIPEGHHGRLAGPLKLVSRIGFDLTAPKADQVHFWRGQYPEINLEKWLTKEQIASARAQQNDYAKLLARKRV
jgi:4-hydroxy-3-polyprenylbenzoate decarboxylase